MVGVLLVLAEDVLRVGFRHCMSVLRDDETRLVIGSKVIETALLLA